MAFCKICACGEKIVFERRLGYPENCPSCNRKMVDFLTYNEDDPRVVELLKEHDDTQSVTSKEEEPLTCYVKENLDEYLEIIANENIQNSDD